MTLTQLAIFVPAALLVALSPGANNLLAFANATRAGWLPAVRAVSGRLAAFALMIGAVALGLDALLRTSETAFQLLKWAGVAYLAHLGVRTWRAPVEAPPVAAAGLARREMLTALGNPKAYLLFTAFLPQFVDPAASMAPQLVVLGALYIAIEGCAAAVWAGVGAWLGGPSLTRARRRLLNRLSGGVMIGAAALLARAQRQTA